MSKKESGTKTRRNFLVRLAGFVVAGGAVLSTWSIFRSLIPNVLYEPPKRFPIGDPDRLQQGVTFLDEHRVYLIRDGNRFHCISGICSHLGCTVKYAPFARIQEKTVRDLSFTARGEFHCPCHGSKFHGEGTNYSGPAPRPLKWFQLEISPANGAMIVDLGREVDRNFRLVV